ncbi:MAG: oligosaccharide flippase family protein [Anaerolineaceae bacterium]|nr:oligosaccharide flippase family protein [Anaerolineaceae bacterium]
MNPVQKLIQGWKADALMQKVIRNTGYLFSSNTIAMILGAGQGILAAILLGPAGYGTLGLVITLATSLNRLFSFRMGELVIKYAGQDLAINNQQRASAIVKTAFLAEATTTILAYIILVLTSPWTAALFIKDATVTGWIAIYGLSLLFNLVNETSTAVLQLGNHYRSQAMVNLTQSVVTALLIVIAFFRQGSVFDVMMAYLLGKAINGTGIFLIALSKMKSMFGEEWFKAPLRLIEQPLTMARFAISTNLSGTINLVIRDSDILWVGLFLNPTASGYYKFAIAMMNVMLMPITPFISTTFPEISRSVAKRTWGVLKGLLIRTSSLAAIWTGACMLGVLLFGHWALSILKDGLYLPSFGLVLILILGYGIANILFWNRPLLLAFGKPNFPLIVTFLVGLGKVLLMVFLIPIYGVNAMAWLMSAYFIVSVGIIAVKGIKLVYSAHAEDNKLLQPGAA